MDRVPSGEIGGMRIALMLLGVVIIGGALFIWVWLNGMAAAWNTSGSKSSITWFSREAFWFFWLPVAVGAGILFLGWRRS